MCGCAESSGKQDGQSQDARARWLRRENQHDVKPGKECPASFPAGETNQERLTCSSVVISIRDLLDETNPFLRSHLSWPVSGLASRTASPSHARRTVVLRDGQSPRATLDYRCGGSTRTPMSASCFPFNCAHEHVRGHQNATIIRRAVSCGNRCVGRHPADLDCNLIKFDASAQ